MFTWEKSLQKLDAPAAQVLHLFRSMRDVQLALPGQPVQQASAYLCQYRRESGVATVAVFHMQKSQSLAFYCSDPVIVMDDKAESMLDKGLNFVESMGFLLSDMDLHLLADKDRTMLWDSLPLAAGLHVSKPEEEAFTRSESKVPVAKKQPKAAETPAKATMATETENAGSTPKLQPLQTSVPPADEVEDLVDEELADDTVDDLIAAVEALRAKRPAMRIQRKTPKPVEVQKRRQELREELGRILSSL